MPRADRALTALVLLALLSAALAACSGNSGSTPRATSDTFAPPPTTTPAPTSTPGGPNENGQAPVFYRTADNFAHVVANQPYKVLFRLTNGYAENTATVTARCTSCFGNPPPETFTSTKAEPGGKESPGSYYPTNLVFPVEGRWEITVEAAPDSAAIPVDVQPAP